jgi:hypothetical protein
VKAAVNALSGYDVLLEWASERSEGPWAQWCDAARQLRVEPNGAVQDFAALGHVEVDWSANRFSCPPPTAAYLPGSSGCVVVTGARPRGFIAQLRELEAERDDLGFCLHGPYPQHHGPDTLLIEVDLDDAQALCEAARLVWAFDPAHRIAQLLPHATLETVAERESWPPRDGVPRQRFNPKMMRFETERGESSQRGLWSYDGYRRSEAWLFDGCSWWMFPTREYAMYLAHPEVTFLRYRQTACQLLVPLLAPLPPLQARAATLASGRLPLSAVSKGPRSLAYENISPALAERIAESLRTPLEVQP